MSRDWTREEFGITDNTPVVDIDSLERKCERLQKQLEIAVEAIKAVLHDEFILEHADAGLVMYLT